MKTNNVFLIISSFIAMVFFFNSCDTEETNNDQIIHKNVDKEYVFLRNTQDVNIDDSPISEHIDSILNGYIDSEIISTGFLRFNLDDNTSADMAFEILDLQPFNNNNLPESFDSLAIRAHAYNVEFLDNSTYQYADALDNNTSIDVSSHWTSQTIVLGTFADAGNFNGHGIKFLGFRFNNNETYKYGWIKVYCSKHNDTLKVIDYAYNDFVDSKILAGQTE